jgi:P-type Ca2+ transporter type 2C
VAREAASLVLLDDNFSSIVQAVRLGRRIYDNLQKAMGYILAIHVPIAGIALLPILLGAPLVLTPLLIALLEMIIDPTCSIALEAEHGEADVMRRPPRPRAQRILSLQLLVRSVLQGALALALAGAVFLWARSQGLPPETVRAASFVAIVTVVIGLLLVNRSFDNALQRRTRRRWNLPLLVLLGIIVLVIGALVLLPATQRFLQLAPLTPLHWALALGAGAVLVLLLEAAKGWPRRKRTAA